MSKFAAQKRPAAAAPLPALKRVRFSFGGSSELGLELRSLRSVFPNGIPTEPKEIAQYIRHLIGINHKRYLFYNREISAAIEGILQNIRKSEPEKIEAIFREYARQYEKIDFAISEWALEIITRK